MSNRPGLTVWGWFLGALISFLFFYFVLKIFPPRPSVVYVPVQSPLVVQHVPDPSLSQSQSFPQQFKKKESQIVSTAGGDYSGYIEHDGKRYNVYGPFVKSQTFKYYSQGRNIKALTVEINGVLFEMLFDTCRVSALFPTQFQVYSPLFSVLNFKTYPVDLSISY